MSKRSVRWAARVVLALAAALLTLNAAVGPALAQPTAPAPAPDPLDPLCRDHPQLPICAPGLPEPPPGAGQQPPATPLPTPPASHSTGLGGMFDIADGYGARLSNYDLFGDPPPLWRNPLPTLWLALANIFFSIGKYAVGFSVWFTEFAMSDTLLDPIQAAAQDLEAVWATELIGRLRLRELLLTLATLHLGYLVLRGYTRKAWAELLSTIAVNVLATAVITHPVAFLVGDDGMLTLTRQIGADTTAAISGQEPSTAGSVAWPITQTMVDNLLIGPWETLNYGEPITDPPGTQVNPCAGVVAQIRQYGPWSAKDDDTPRTLLRDCNPTYADYNATIDADRMFGALGYMIAAVLFMILTFALVAIQVLAPYLLLLEGLLLLLAMLAAQVPRWQYLLTRRISSIAATLGAVLAGMLFLAVMALLLRTLLSADLGPQLVRFAVVDLAVFSGFLMRRRLQGGLQQVRANVDRGLQRAANRHRTPVSLPRTALLAAGSENRLGRLIGDHKQAFKATIAPATNLKSQLASAATALGGTAGKAAAIGKTALAYTAGAPVSWPAAATRATTALTTRGNQLRTNLAAKATGARDYAHTYTNNLGKAATTAARVTGIRAVAGLIGTGGSARSAQLNAALATSTDAPTGPPPFELDPTDPGATRIHQLTPPIGSTVPDLIDPHPAWDAQLSSADADAADQPNAHLDLHPSLAAARGSRPVTLISTAPAGSNLPPGMLPPPASFVTRLKDKLHRGEFGGPA